MRGRCPQVLSSFDFAPAFFVSAVGLMAAVCGTELFRLRNHASRLGLIVRANSAGVIQLRPECGR